MYETALILHSWLRWAVLLAGAWAVARALGVQAARRPWSAADSKVSRVFVILLDVQLLVGLLLYGVASPFVASALSDMGAAMKSADLRYWAVEHPLMMLVALAVAHVGQARLKRAGAGASPRQALVYFGIALALLIVAAPWPGMSNARPLARFW